MSNKDDDAEQDRKHQQHEATIDGIICIERIADALDKLAECVAFDKNGKAYFRIVPGVE